MDDIPETQIDQVTMIEGILTAAATTGSDDGPMYGAQRRELVADDRLKPLLLPFVRTYRSLGAFWPFIEGRTGTYAERRQIISSAFTPLGDYLEGRGRAPSDEITTDALATFDAEAVQAVWSKALARRTFDFEGAITIARTLLETVCKRILNELGLLMQRRTTSRSFKGRSRRRSAWARPACGGADQGDPGRRHELGQRIGTLRNRFSDAHAPGTKMPVKPSERHASIAHRHQHRRGRRVLSRRYVPGPRRGCEVLGGSEGLILNEAGRSPPATAQSRLDFIPANLR